MLLCVLQADDQIYGRQDRIYSSKFETEPLYQWYAKDKIIRSNISETSASDSNSATESDDGKAGKMLSSQSFCDSRNDYLSLSLSVCLSVLLLKPISR